MISCGVNCKLYFARPLVAILGITSVDLDTRYLGPSLERPAPSAVRCPAAQLGSRAPLDHRRQLRFYIADPAAGSGHGGLPGPFPSEGSTCEIATRRIPHGGRQHHAIGLLVVG